MAVRARPKVKGLSTIYYMLELLLLGRYRTKYCIVLYLHVHSTYWVLLYVGTTFIVFSYDTVWTEHQVPCLPRPSIEPINFFLPSRSATCLYFKQHMKHAGNVLLLRYFCKKKNCLYNYNKNDNIHKSNAKEIGRTNKKCGCLFNKSIVQCLN